ncbi:hypothetical protein OYC64_005420 [Pagothenia borchgrevinki]|uniref:TIR domain-containing protein n=1 Tax=Pagothenia borchgrevinki TaxID=8213 RepID=A0ABD2GFM7_PAGBO
MWTSALQLVFIGFYLQVPTCYPSCTFHGLVADCPSRNHYWVPALPPNITHLYLQMNFISEINSSSLRNYDHLQQLDLGMQKVPLVLRNNAFLRQRKLTKLVLGSNIGLQMEPRAFAGLFHLQHLFLDYCNLPDSILAERYLEPLLSLETLDLSLNEIVRLRPGLFFSKLTKFTQLNLKLNPIETLCEDDLVGFRGKYFKLLNLNSNTFYRGYSEDFDWKKCGNPFTGMAFEVLDLSSSGFNTKTSTHFFKAIEGTPITHLIFSGHLGRDFSFSNIPDPDESTFEGLMNSSVNILDLSKSRIFALQKAVLSPLRNAIIIDISLNRINQIDQNAFNGLQGHLRMLNLSYNLLGEVYSYTFTNLNDLRVLDLSYNHIGALAPKAFSGLPKLRALYLTGNSLRGLGSPAALPNLDYLLLGDNKLKSLYGISKFGNNGIHLDIANNRLTNLEDVYIILTSFNRLQNFFYGGNIIKWCTMSLKVPHISLEVLDLHDSSLNVIWARGECLDLFDHLDNLLGLNISYNSIATFPKGIFSGLNSIYEIDVSSNALTYLQQDLFPTTLKRLDLSDNFLASPDPVTFLSLSFLSLAENRFYCDCNLESFLKWLNVTNVTFASPTEEYRCEFPAALQNLPLGNFSRVIEPCEEDDAKAIQDLQLALFIFNAVLVITVILSGFIYARLRGHIFIIYKTIVGRVLEGPKPNLPVDEVQYDAFLSFSENDYGWVEAALLKKLDNQFSEENLFRCCFEARDFLPGEDHLTNIRDAIWSSRKTVCVVSKEFLKDGWCLEAFTLAQGRMLEELTNVLVMVVVGKMAHYQLMKYHAVRAFVQRREYLTWPEDPQDLEWFYERLVSKILKDTKVKKFAEDQPEPAQPDAQPQEEEGIQLENIGPIPCQL